MNPLVVPAQPFFQWLLHTSWQAGILVCLILLIQKALGRRLGVRGRYWLWLVLVIRLAMFWAPPSPVSVYNLLPAPQLAGYGSAATPQSGSVGPALTPTDGTDATGGYGGAGPAASGLASQARRLLDARGAILFVVWLAGACTLAGCIVAGHIRLRRIVRRESLVTDRRILDLLEECQRQMGTRGPVGVIATDAIDSPALLGFVRPRLLLPRATIAELSPEALRHVFLHELAHLRRDDIVIGYLTTLLQVLHWFNPLVVLAFKRMRADQEMVCDALAMSALPPDETTAYGRTIIHQIEQLQLSRPHWMMAALSGDRARIKQRIAMIAQFQRETFRWSPLAFVLVALLACTGLTNGLPAPWVPPVYGPARDVPTTHQNEHKNIDRIVIRHRDTAKYLVVHGETVTCDANTPGDAGLWEVRFDEAAGNRDHIIYLYSVVGCKYLTWDKEGRVAANGSEPDEAARWSIWGRGDGFLVTPHPFAHFYLRLTEQGHVKAPYGNGPGNIWDIEALWRIKTSDDPKSDSEFRRKFIPGPDWGPPWSTVNRRR